MSGRVFHVTIGQTKIGSFVAYKDALFWGGDVGELPQTALISIQVQENNEAVFVPLSAYGGLGDVLSASLDSTKTGAALRLHGGHTAASYDAELIFDHGVLVSRIVELRDMPRQRRERTTYTFPR
jgi:hypothetical protein